MDRTQALKIVKAAIETMKKGIITDSIAEKESVTMMMEVFMPQIEQALEVLENE